MKRTVLSLLSVIIFIGLSSAAPTNPAGKRIVCYFGSWAVYRYGAARITEEDIDMSLCDYFIYSFVGLDSAQADIRLLDAWNDIGDEWHRGLIIVLRDKARAMGTKFIVAMGGWNEGSESYSKVVGNPTQRAILVANIVKFVETYDCDGFDLDWEFPGQRGGAPGDKEAFSAFVTELKEQFKPRGWWLSAAVTANALTIDTSYNVPLISDQLDMINVMTYDLHGPWEDVTGHNSPLTARASDFPDNGHLNVEHAMESWISKGAQPEKLNVGIGTYGRSFTLLNAANNGIGAAAGGIAPAGWTNEAGFIGYDEICSKNGTEWVTKWDDEQKVPFAVSDRKWVGYDDVASVREKICMANRLNIGGAIIWTIETDDFHGNCGQGKYPLIRAVASAFADKFCGGSGYEPSATNPPAATTASTPTSVESSTTTVASPALTDTPATDTTTTSAGDTDENSCQSVGYQYADPHDCSWFYRCAPSQDGSPLPMKFFCGSGLKFDRAIGGCNYESLVNNC